MHIIDICNFENCEKNDDEVKASTLLVVSSDPRFSPNRSFSVAFAVLYQ